jgi:inactivated superfamily I helicase
MRYEVRYWLEDGARFASWLVTADRAEASRVADELQRRRRRNRIEVVEVMA